jgi:hypothetical protein
MTGSMALSAVVGWWRRHFELPGHRPELPVRACGPYQGGGPSVMPLTDTRHCPPSQSTVIESPEVISLRVLSRTTARAGTVPCNTHVRPRSSRTVAEYPAEYFNNLQREGAGSAGKPLPEECCTRHKCVQGLNMPPLCTGGLPEYHQALSESMLWQQTPPAAHHHHSPSSPEVSGLTTKSG